MTKTLTKHGNSYALVLDRPLMDILNIRPETPLEITTDGESLHIKPVVQVPPAQPDTAQYRMLDTENNEDDRILFEKAMEETNREYASVLKKLAE